MVALIGILFATLFNINIAHEALPEGAACTADGYPGTCKLWKKCYTLLVDHQKNTYPPVCSFDGNDPILCCTSCDTVEDLSKAEVDPTGGVLWKNNQKSWNKCIDYFISAPYACKNLTISHIRKEWNDSAQCFGIHFERYVDTDSEKTITPYVVDGRDAMRTEYPHMALLGYGSITEPGDWLCGGTIISDRFILTAAHCIFGSRNQIVKFAALGTLKRSDPIKLWQIYDIKRIIPHPEYSSPSKYNDIALLKTDREISFNVYVLPACLPHLGVAASDGDAEATGWGALDYKGGVADTLQVVSLKKFNESTCSMLYRVQQNFNRGYDHLIQMCYGSDNKTNVGDTCTGDSGGPLHIPGQASACQKTVIGVTSFGHGCGIFGSAGIYTRVDPYVPWIESIVWP